MQVFQDYARDMFPQSREKKANAVMTLNYLFRDSEWDFIDSSKCY